MLKKHWKLILEVMGLILIVLIGGVLYYAREARLLDTELVDALKKPYKVEAGMNARVIAHELTQGKHMDEIIRIWIYRHPELQAVQKGMYTVDGKKTLKELLTDMVQGNVAQVQYKQLGIIEGSNISHLDKNYQKLLPKAYDEVKKTLAKPAEFIITSLENDQKLLESIGGAGHSLEGLLMPATYPIYHVEYPLEPIENALRATARFMAAQWPTRDKDILIRTPYEALIIASIIERETLVDKERPQVAAVFYNRLRKKMRLQTDPTVMYGVSPSFSGRLTKDQLKKDTPYNTYTRDGLPPTPISMPSKASIIAALHPAKIDALYFVAADEDPSHGHTFTATLNEHNKAVSDYRRKVADYKKNQKNDDAKTKVADGLSAVKSDPDKASDKKNDATGKSDQDNAKSKDLANDAANDANAVDIKSATDNIQQNNLEKTDSTDGPDKKTSAPAAVDPAKPQDKLKSDESALSQKSADEKRESATLDQNAAQVSENKGQTIITIDDKNKSGADKDNQATKSSEKKVDSK